MSEEEALIRAFVVKGKRDRWLECLSNPKRRSTLRGALAHFRDLDPRFIVALASNEQHAEAVAAKLRRYGATDTCSVISENLDIDGMRMALDTALEAVIGRGMGTLLSCVPGTLAYFEGEDAGHRCILARSP
jgi:hypothetical protein